MQNLLQLWQALDARRRMIVAGATVAVFVAVLSLSRMAGTPGMALLYAGLDSATAGDVVAALDQASAQYEIRGDAIFVEEALRDSLRMTLAAEGLPANSGSGYELLDGLSGFGTTSQMFDAAYWRAREGELARTILANPAFRAARVHIAQAPAQPFQTDVHPTASVTITSAAGGLGAAQAKSVRHLVAAAVPGMRPEDVAVIDTVAGLIDADTANMQPDAAGNAHAAEIKRNVERLLAARVGAGKAVVEVAVDVVTDREQITERKFDPQGRVAISSETESNTGSSTEPGGAVTVASNLPSGDAGAGASGKSDTSASKERINYEVSETQREILRNPGSVRKISIAVLVDGQTVTAADGSVSQELRPEAELLVLRELVASAVGLDEARGDVLTLRSLAFLPDPAGGALAEAGMFASFGPIDLMSMVQTIVLALVALVLGLFVIRPVLSSAGRRPAELPALAQALALTGGSANATAVLNGVIDDGTDLPPFSVIAARDAGGAEAVDADPVARLRRLIEERQTESVEILRGWMEYEEERG